MAKHKLDLIYCVDVEATCWEPDELTAAHVDPHPMEVIEIGMCVYDRRLDTVRPPRSLMVLPTVGYVSRFCTDLTGIEGHVLQESGVPFERACDLVRDTKAGRNVWASWGDFDRNLFTRQCEREGVRYPWPPTHLNVKQLFALVLGLDSAVELGLATNIASLGFKGRPHTGKDDAHNVARIVQWLCQRWRRKPL